ncbi:MAG: nicotinic acid mononucleotide adenylyltransferase, partial [Rhodospirillaceae bacterium]
REDRRIRVTTLEHAFGTQYTADTMVVLKRRFPKARFVFLIGADNLIQLPRWDRWERLMTTVPIAVFDRAPYSVRALAGLAARRYRPFRRVGNRCFGLAQATPPAWVFLPIRKHAASATDLRARGWGALESKAQSDAERNGEDDS